MMRLEKSGIMLIVAGVALIIAYIVGGTLLEMHLNGVFAGYWQPLPGELPLTRPPESVLEIDPYIPVFGGLWQVNYFRGIVTPTLRGFMIVGLIAGVIILCGAVLAWMDQHMRR